jgi:hypothetical protein
VNNPVSETFYYFIIEDDGQSPREQFFKFYTPYLKYFSSWWIFNETQERIFSISVQERIFSISVPLSEVDLVCSSRFLSKIKEI